MPVFCLFAGMQLSTVVQTLDVMEEANKNRMLMCRGILIPGGISRRHVQKHGCSHWANKPRMSHESLWRCDISCHRFLIHCSCAGLHWGQCTVNVEKLGNGRHIQTCGNQAALDNMARLLKLGDRQCDFWKFDVDICLSEAETFIFFANLGRSRWVQNTIYCTNTYYFS